MDHVATGASPVPPKRSKAEPTQPPNSNHSANPTILVIPTRAKHQEESAQWTMDHVATGASPVPPKRSKAEPTQPPNSNHSANPTSLVIPTQREAPRRNLLSWLPKTFRIRHEPKQSKTTLAPTLLPQKSS